MIPDINLIGNSCLWFALIASAVGVVAVWAGHPRLGRWIAYGNFFALTTAGIGMMFALLTNDFSVSYVAHVGALETPRFFSAISLWSSLEGSILLWGWILSFYTAASLFCYRKQFSHLMPWVNITLLLIGCFFYLVLLFPANPFVPMFPVPMNGPGPNPLLQNHWLMSVHPPLLYLGYVGMSVPFSFAVASMVTGDLSDTWVWATRRWTLIAWMFLSCAIIAGGWWSYAVLGWGGYWAWDPVENASFMPWLTATAFLHSVMVQQRRQMLKIWNLVLIVITFLLTILGTFLTRSGVLESVHAFTVSGIGHYFLSFIGIALATSVALLIWKAPRFKSPGKFDSPLSRETLFMFNNLFLVCFCFVVLLGTLYPLIVEALQGIRVSVGAPFFNLMTVPLAVTLLLIMGIGSALPWRRAEPKDFFKQLTLPTLFLLLAPTVGWLEGIHEGWVLATLSFSAFTFSVMVLQMWKGRFISGGFIVHIGIVVMAIGLAFSGSYQKGDEVTLREGEIFESGKFTVQLEKLWGQELPQRFEIVADVNVLKNNRRIATLQPKLNFYNQSREPIGSPAVRSTVTEDLYLTLLAFDPKKKEVSLRVMLTPLVSWIWSGLLFIVAGVMISAFV